LAIIYEKKEAKEQAKNERQILKDQMKERILES